MTAEADLLLHAVLPLVAAPSTGGEAKLKTQRGRGNPEIPLPLIAGWETNRAQICVKIEIISFISFPVTVHSTTQMFVRPGDTRSTCLHTSLSFCGGLPRTAQTLKETLSLSH